MEQYQTKAQAIPGAYPSSAAGFAATQTPYGQMQYANQPVTLLPSSSHIVSAGIFGMIVAGTGTLGANLHKVQAGEMGMGEALSQSLLHGAAAGAATAAASAAASSFTKGGLLGLGAMLATATGVSYLINKG